MYAVCVCSDVNRYERVLQCERRLWCIRAVYQRVRKQAVCLCGWIWRLGLEMLRYAVMVAVCCWSVPSFIPSCLMHCVLNICTHHFLHRCGRSILRISYIFNHIAYATWRETVNKNGAKELEHMGVKREQNDKANEILIAFLLCTEDNAEQKRTVTYVIEASGTQSELRSVCCALLTSVTHRE